MDDPQTDESAKSPLQVSDRLAVLRKAVQRLSTRLAILVPCTVIEQNEREIDAALKRSAALRQSILKQAFSGTLVPQDPTDEPAPTLLARIKAERAKAGKSKPRKIAHAG